MGMKVVAHDPGLTAAAIRARGARPLSLARLLGAADVISLHAPHTASTHHLIDSGALARMKKGALLVNAAGAR